MKEHKNIFPKIKLSKVKILKNIDLLNLPILNQSDISNLNSQKINSKNNVKQIRIKEDSKNNQSQKSSLNNLTKPKNIYSLKKAKTFAQMVNEVAEKNMSNYLILNLKKSYDMFEGAYVTENENQDDIYNDNIDNISENFFDDKCSLSMRVGNKLKKLKRNYSQDFITVRDRVLKNDNTKINQYKKLLCNNRSNKVEIKIRNKDFNNLLSSYNAMSQNKLIYDNITKNYKETMVSEYAETIHKLNPIIKIKEKNKHQRIKIFSNIGKNNNEDFFQNVYYNNEDELSIKNNKNKSLNFPLNTRIIKQLFDKSLLLKRNRLYLLKNSYQYPSKNFPGSLSEFSVTQNEKECILFGGNNSSKLPYVWKFNNSECSWELIKPDGNTTFSRAGHIAAYKNKNLYVFGGIYNQFKTYADLEIFNFDTKK